MTAAKEYNALPTALQTAIARDWIACGKTGAMRGTGVATHYLYLQMIAAEHDLAITDLMDTANN
jgi:hypothetical protein